MNIWAEFRLNVLWREFRALWFLPSGRIKKFALLESKCEHNFQINFFGEFSIRFPHLLKKSP